MRTRWRRRLRGGIRESPRAIVVEAAHLAVLWTFAVAWPLLNLLGDNGTFFVAHGSTRLDIVLFAVVVVFGVPVILLALELVAALAGPGVRRAVHIAFFGVLAAVLATYLLKKATGSTSGKIVPCAVVLGAAAAALYGWRPEVRWGMSAISPVPVLILALFLLFSPVHRLVLGSADARLVGATPRMPVVVVLLDELPVTSLLATPDRIDSVRYPNFARLARTSTWYVNTSASAQDTEVAIPAIMTGQWPRKGTLPTLRDHPQNVFTLFGGRRPLNVDETFTHLCPEAVCRESRAGFASRMRSLAHDSGVVALHLTLPRDLETHLPSISTSWRNFGGSNGNGGGGGDESAANAEAADEQRGRVFDDWVRRIAPRETAPLNLIHILLPHVPFQYLPSGATYNDGGEMLGSGLLYDRWVPGFWPAVQGYQRHLLQTGYVDRLIGDLIGDLKRKGVWDRALVVVVADHGAYFHGGADRRAVSMRNVADIAPVPLFVKAPHQERGRIVRTHLQTIDILPTIADMAGVRIPWHVDGHSALRPGADRRTITVFKAQNRGPGGKVTIAASRLDALRLVALRYKLRLFGAGDGPPGLFGAGPDAQILGRRAGDLPRASAPGVHATLEQTALLGNVEPGSGFLPIHLTGTVVGSHPPAAVAATVGGRIAATGPVVSSPDETRYSIMLPPAALRRGANAVAVYALERRNGAVALAPLVREGLRASSYRVEGDAIVGPGGRRYRFTPRGRGGYLDHAGVSPSSVRYDGWVADVKAHRPADAAAVVVGPHVVAVVRPTVPRPGVVQALDNPKVLRSGFVVDVPMEAIRRAGGLRRARVLALADGKALPLQLNCQVQPRPAGCPPPR